MYFICYRQLKRIRKMRIFGRIIFVKAGWCSAGCFHAGVLWKVPEVLLQSIVIPKYKKFKVQRNPKYENTETVNTSTANPKNKIHEV